MLLNLGPVLTVYQKHMLYFLTNQHIFSTQRKILKLNAFVSNEFVNLCIIININGEPTDKVS